MIPPFKPFCRMTPEDYAAVGLRCGLEVHQQLLTDRKLFCRCPAGRYSDAYDAELVRHMRPTLSELGEYDGTALMEKKTRKNIHYLIHHATVCTYEFDDTPPFFPDPRAVDIALEISLALELNLVGEMHIARKQYLDGSIPAGFQRTAILGVEGTIPYGERRILVRQLSIEEDSCREVSDVGHDRVFLTDRLGMPLIEVVTEPDMRTPRETAEVCQLIRLLCRSTGKVRRGYGAARQDVNVSVRGGTRIEIKGVPQITRIPLLVYNEAMRQWALLAIRDTLNERGITSKTLQWSMCDVSHVMAGTPFVPIRKSLERGEKAFCVVLKGFAGLLNRPTQEHTTFAKEFSDRVRVIACMTRLPNLVHSDTAAEMLSARDWKLLRRRSGAGDDDALILVWGSEQDTATAVEEIVIRAREATEGVPSDTRQALKDGTNGFERVLPGAERMYPDTDLPPMAITAERIENIRAGMPVAVWRRLARYRKMGLPADVIEPLCTSSRAGLFDRLVDELNVDPTWAAVVLVQRFKAMTRSGLRPERLPDENVFRVFQAHQQGRLTVRGVCRVLERLLRHEAGMHEAGMDEHCHSKRSEESRPIPGQMLRSAQHDDHVSDLIADVAGAPVDDDELRRQMEKSLCTADGSRFSTDEQRFRFVMGALMRKLDGRVEGRRVAGMLTALMTGDSMDTAHAEART